MPLGNKCLSIKDQERLIEYLIEIAQDTGVPVRFRAPGNCGVSYNHNYQSSPFKLNQTTLSDIEVPLPTTENRALIFLHEIGHLNYFQKNGISTWTIKAQFNDNDNKLTIPNYIQIVRYEVNAWKEAIKLYDRFNFSFSKESWVKTATDTILSYYDAWGVVASTPPAKATLLVSQLFATIDMRCSGFLELIGQTYGEFLGNNS